MSAGGCDRVDTSVSFGGQTVRVDSASGATFDINAIMNDSNLEMRKVHESIFRSHGAS